MDTLYEYPDPVAEAVGRGFAAQISTKMRPEDLKKSGPIQPSAVVPWLETPSHRRAKSRPRKGGVIKVVL